MAPAGNPPAPVAVRPLGITVGDDGVNRTKHWAFTAKTGRNSASTTEYIWFAVAALRHLIQAPPGYSFSSIDYSAQEFCIAAALSKDPLMLAAYSSGDPYLWFGKHVGLLPVWATKQTHAAERDLIKTLVLALSYGMGFKAFANRAGVDEGWAKQMVQSHKQAFPVFWNWIIKIRGRASLLGELRTPLGWRLFTGQEKPTTVQNFLVQGTAADILHLAVIDLVENGIYPVALLSMMQL